MKRIYIAGNPLLKEDSVPFLIQEGLKKMFPLIEFREIDPSDNLPEEETLNIIDTMIGIDDVTVIKDIDKIVHGKVYSLHDFDLGFNLKLMSKMGRLKKVNIIGIPPHMTHEKALEKVGRAIVVTLI